jgi:hypothetical protein
MRFHFPSFALGWAAGVATAAVLPRLKPLLVELFAAGYGILDAVAVRAAVAREDFQDLVAEARAKVKAPSAPAGEATA